MWTGPLQVLKGHHSHALISSKLRIGPRDSYSERLIPLARFTRTWLKELINCHICDPVIRQMGEYIGGFHYCIINIWISYLSFYWEKPETFWRLRHADIREPIKKVVLFISCKDFHSYIALQGDISPSTLHPTNLCTLLLVRLQSAL